MARQSETADPAESSAAQSFAADLDSMFGLGGGGGIAALSHTVEQKKANVSSGQSELEQLEARLRETEQRLAKVSRQNSPSRQQQQQQQQQQQEQADSGATTAAAIAMQKQPSPLAQRPTYPDDRPPTGKRPPSKRDDVAAKVQDMPGALPETPGQAGGREDYVMVDSRNR